MNVHEAIIADLQEIAQANWYVYPSESHRLGDRHLLKFEDKFGQRVLSFKFEDHEVKVLSIDRTVWFESQSFDLADPASLPALHKILKEWVEKI